LSYASSPRLWKEFWKKVVIKLDEWLWKFANECAIALVSK